MARILYGIAGEGMGHATRAKPIIEELSRHHELRLLSGSRAYRYLLKHFPNVHRIFCFHIVYRSNAVSNLGIILYNSLRIPLLIWSFLKTLAIALAFRPRLIITDYDPFTCYAGLLLGIPVVSISNQHVLNRTGVQYPRGWESFKTRLATALLIPHARRYIVTAFSAPPRVRPRTTIVRPILRQEIARLKPTPGEHVLVYQTSRSNSHLLRMLTVLPHRFIVYGFGARAAIGNVIFKAFNEDEFFRDLATCKAVLTNGGYSLMSEAISLGKPVLSEPVRKQFEQTLNALLLEREGYGLMTASISRERIERFLGAIETHRLRLRKMQLVDATAGLQQAVAVIENVIQRASSAALRSSVPAPSLAAVPSPFRSEH